MLKTRKRLLCDVDGVLADFASAATAVAVRVLGMPFPANAQDEWDMFRHLQPEDRARVYEALHEPGFCRGLLPLPGAVEGMREFRGVADVYFVTSPMQGMTWTRERELWLAEHFGASTREIIHTSAKHVCVGDALLDDKVQNVVSWQRYHPEGVGIVWDAQYNRRAAVLHRARSWSDVTSILGGEPT
jgi:5'(3')-deoxyribonucleotidase